MRKHHNETFRLTLSALLLALMLVLGWVESLLPSFAVPGIKLGLSNGVLIFAVYMLDIPTAYSLMALKVVLSGLLFGNPSAMLYAFAGGLLSLTAMALLSRLRWMKPLVVSMAGGLLHNVGQVGMAMLVLRSPRQMLYYMGILMAVGIACGALTGIAATAVMRHLKSAHWQLPSGRRRGGALVLAALLVIGAGVWAVLSQPRTGAVIVETSTDAPQLMTFDQLNLETPGVPTE